MKKNEENTPKPVEKIEINESHLKLRVILFIISFCVVIICAIIILVNYLKEDDGWTSIEANPSVDINCSEDFVFSYDLGNTDISSTKEAREITLLYSEAIEKAYTLYNPYKMYDEITNIAYINSHYNEELTIDPLLYDTFATIKEYDSNYLYLGPIAAYYEDLISTSNETEANALDPYQNDAVKAYFNDIIEFINNGDINIDLLDNYRIKLSISDDYKSFAIENEIINFIDLVWLKNAFIIDYVSSALVAAGHTNGTISSYDGYSKNLDNTNSYNYILNILDNPSKTPSIVGKVVTKKPISVVQFRGFMYYQSDINRYIKMSDGTYRHYYFSSVDGLSKASVNSLTCYSDSLSCVSIALKSMKFFINDSFTTPSAEGVEFIWCKDSLISYTESIVIENIYPNYKGEEVNDWKA